MGVWEILANLLTTFFGAGIAAWIAFRTQRKDLEAATLQHREQLISSAVEKRLEAHQQAFSLHHEMLFMLFRPEDERYAKLGEVREWWFKNCLYLSPEVFEDLEWFLHMFVSYRDMWPDMEKSERQKIWRRMHFISYKIRKSVSLPVDDFELPALPASLPAK